jgi:hypothetical protein
MTETTAGIVVMLNFPPALKVHAISSKYYLTIIDE